MERDNRISQTGRTKSLKSSVKRRVGRFSLRKLSAPDSPEKRLDSEFSKECVVKSNSLGSSW